MLSRIAESLYWLGRYVERAEDTARILDVHYHLVLEERLSDESAASLALLDAMGIEVPPEAAPDVTAATRLLAFDTEHSGSIVVSLDAAWRNARSTRQVLSSELWEALNSTHLALPDQAALYSRYHPHAFFGWVKERTAMIAGLTEATMSHDDGWRFLVLGRSLERVDMTARLLSTCDGAWGRNGWITTLRSCGAHEAYLLTHRRAVDASRAAEFLLLDRLFPRSLFGALEVAERRLGELAPGPARGGVDDDARRSLGRARAELEFLRPDELLVELPDRLERVQQLCADAGSAIARRYFPAPVARWVA